ncbi:DNA topoisomerase 1 isoform X2 [Benincasa hispida]|uniref:DNA topoisomerase 1 isoform X2 n=1 Tax=Benincasa hispida TaxID=102211 RepID=UPI0018FFBA4E|nr:DNA topoisomerase 1 isoform X2 [Benincasa hispida]
MSQLQRSLLLATSSSNAISSSVFSTTPSASSSRLRPFMAKLQSSTIQNYTSKCIPVLPFSTTCNYARCSQLVFRKGRVTFAIKTERANAGQYRTRDEPNCVFTLYSRLPLGFVHSVASPNAPNWQLLNGTFTPKLPNYRAFGKKFFSKTTETLNGTENKNVKYVRNGTSTLPFEGLNKKWKGAKPVATSRLKRISASGPSGSTSVDGTNSSDQLVGTTKEAGLVSSDSSSSIRKASKGLKEKKSGSKKKKEAISSTNDADVEAACKDGQSKSLDSSNIDQDVVQDPKKNVTGSTSKGSASTKQQSNKKKGNSSRKREAKKDANKLPQKPNFVVDARGKSQGITTFKQLYPPMGKSVMVVESVTKAKVIQNYLGDMFEVLPSHGHVRDLAARSGSVRPDDDFSMVWEVPSAAWTHLKSIKVALNGAENLILASDPDREGEAIAWHIIEMLRQQDALHEGISIARVVFHEITETSIKSALQSPRIIDTNLVQAYLARRALDYLIGFNISPLLWRKLPGCQSAGRVQSAALALICDREMEIDEFHAQEYWTIDIKLKQKDPCSSVEEFAVPAHLTHFESKKLNQFAISSNTEAKNIETALKSVNFQVLSSKKNEVRRNPPMPYITSTLQQDAANRYNFPATYTMKLAQKLYEGIQLADGKAAGLITYPRTDGLHISDEAVKDIRSLIRERYGQNFVSESGRKYFKVKNAQEAHEAIRPTDVQRLPSMLVGTLDEDSHKLYSLIWLRTMACQMQPSITEQIQIDCGLADESIISRSTCSRVQFRGFQEVFEDPKADAVKHKDHEENIRDELFRILNALKPGDQLSLVDVELKQHFTQAPPRYSEGTLVKKMEELGIGRPSTYATTLKVLQDRKYVLVKSRVLHPEFRGRMIFVTLGLGVNPTPPSPANPQAYSSFSNRRNLCNLLPGGFLFLPCKRWQGLGFR